jgi:hypothetical protein
MGGISFQAPRKTWLYVMQHGALRRPAVVPLVSGLGAEARSRACAGHGRAGRDLGFGFTCLLIEHNVHSEFKGVML